MPKACEPYPCYAMKLAAEDEYMDFVGLCRAMK